MILSDRSIRKVISEQKLVINPFNDDNVQPSSYDVTLGTKFKVFKKTHKPYIDVREDIPKDLTEELEVNEEEGLTIHADEFLLGATKEYIKMPDDLVSNLEGRSSVGRLGLVVHSTAGYIDPGFEGTVTLEISNNSAMPIRIYPGMKIGQLVFEEMTTPAEYPYGHEKLGSKYQGQKDPTESSLHEDFK